MKKTITLFVLTTALAVSFQLSAKTIYLSAAGNDTNDGLTHERPVASLSQAYSLAVDNDVISVAGMVVHTAGEVSMDKSLTIKGEDVTAGFDGQTTSKFFVWNGGGQLNLEQLIFKNGMSASTGGAISCVSGSATNVGSVMIKNCIFDSNTASGGHGGAVYAEGCNMTITQCRFSKNSASSNGAAICLLAVNFDASYVIAQSLINENNAVGEGGALFCSSSSTTTKRLTLNFNNSTCYKNNAAKGGAISITPGNLNFGDIAVTLTNLTITENTSSTTGNGGGLRVNGSGTTNVASVNINNCILYNNWSSTSRTDYAGAAGATNVNVKYSMIGNIPGNSGASSQLRRTKFDGVVATDATAFPADMGTPTGSCTSIYYTTTGAATLTLNPLNSEGVVTYASDAMPVNFSDKTLLSDVTTAAVDQRDLKRITTDGKIDCGAYEYDAVELNTPPVATAVAKTTKNGGFSIYPNPVFNGATTLQIGGESDASINVYALSGVKVASLIGRGAVQLPCESLKTGIYLVVVSQGKTESVKKLVVK